MSIETMVNQAQHGNKNSAETLFLRFAGLLKKAAGQNHLRPIYEEALSEATLSFMEAITAYDVSRGVPFAGYAKAKVYGDLRTLFKRERRTWQRESSANESAGEGLELIDTIPDPKNPFDPLLSKLELEAALKQLTPKQRIALHLCFGLDLSQSQAARQLHTSQQGLSARQSRALDRLLGLLAPGKINDHPCDSGHADDEIPRYQKN